MAILFENIIYTLNLINISTGYQSHEFIFVLTCIYFLVFLSFVGVDFGGHILESLLHVVGWYLAFPTIGPRGPGGSSPAGLWRGLWHVVDFVVDVVLPRACLLQRDCLLASRAGAVALLGYCL